MQARCTPPWSMVQSCGPVRAARCGRSRRWRRSPGVATARHGVGAPRGLPGRGGVRLASRALRAAAGGRARRAGLASFPNSPGPRTRAASISIRLSPPSSRVGQCVPFDFPDILLVRKSAFSHRTKPLNRLGLLSLEVRTSPVALPGLLSSVSNSICGAREAQKTDSYLRVNCAARSPPLTCVGLVSDTRLGCRSCGCSWIAGRSVAFICASSLSATERLAGMALRVSMSRRYLTWRPEPVPD